MSSTSLPAEEIHCDADGFEFNAVTGTSLMRALRESGFDIEASCDGNMVCGTCCVHVDPEWQAHLQLPSEDERVMLECLPQSAPTSRLACQIVLTRELDGLKLTIPR